MQNLKYIVTATIFFIIFSGIALAERLTVISSVANVRSGPGAGYDILWRAEKYYPIVVIKKSGPWHFFRDFEEDEGWIHKSLIDKIPSVITKNAKCNIRSGPGLNYKILFYVEKGIPFKVIKRKGKWINIQHADGDRGWIHKSLVW